MSLTIARLMTRELNVSPGMKVGIEVDNQELRAAIESLIDSAGAIAANSDLAGACICHSDLNGFLVPPKIRQIIEQISPGGPIALYIPRHDGNALSGDEAKHLGRRVDLDPVSVVQADDGAVIHGKRRPRLTRARVRELMPLFHTLKATVLIGRSGLTAEVIAATREAVERHGIVKVKLTPQALEDKQEALEALSWATGSQLVKRVGKVGLLYRSDRPLSPPISKAQR